MIVCSTWELMAKVSTPMLLTSTTRRPNLTFLLLWNTVELLNRHLQQAGTRSLYCLTCWGLDHLAMGQIKYLDDDRICREERIDWEPEYWPTHFKLDLKIATGCCNLLCANSRQSFRLSPQSHGEPRTVVLSSTTLEIRGRLYWRRLARTANKQKFKNI